MHEQERLTRDQSEFADALGTLVPRRLDLKPQQAWMEAQRRRWRTQVFTWRGVAAALAAGLIVSLMLRPRTVSDPSRHNPVAPTPEVMNQLPKDNLAAAPRESFPVVLTGDNYIALRSRVLAFGVQTLQPPLPAKLVSDPQHAIDGSLGASEPQPQMNLFGPFSRGGHL